MTRHEIPTDEVEIADGGVAVPLRKYLRFEGDFAVSDDPGDGRTVVSVDSPSGGFTGTVRYVSDPQVIGPGADFDAGDVYLDDGDLSWLHGDSDPATGLWIFASPGLYTAQIQTVLDSTGYATGDQIGIAAEVYFGNQLDTNLNRSYTVERGIRQISASTWGASFTITDYFDNGGLIQVTFLHSSALTSVTGYTDTVLTKVI